MQAEHRVDLGMAPGGVKPRQADRCVGLVDRAVGLDPEVRLEPPFAGAEPGRAVVAGAGVDLVEFYHCMR